MSDVDVERLLAEHNRTLDNLPPVTPKPWRPQGGGKLASVTRYRKVKRPGHPLAHRDGQVYEHRVVLWEKIGSGQQSCHWCDRTITWFGPGGARVVADHLDNDCWNNDPDNLVASCRSCNSERSRRPDFLTHCEQGHPWTPENIYIRPDGTGRACRSCNRRREQERSKRRRQHRKEADLCHARIR